MAVSQINCCKKCVPPVRHLGCHGTCKSYLKEVKNREKEKQVIRQSKAKITLYNDYKAATLQSNGYIVKER